MSLRRAAKSVTPAPDTTETKIIIPDSANASATVPAAIDNAAPAAIASLQALGPAERVGIERDACRLAALTKVALQPDGEIHVFADGGAVVAADGDDGVAAEQAERARDEHDGIL